MGWWINGCPVIVEIVAENVIEPRAGVFDLAAIAAFDEVAKEDVLDGITRSILALGEGGSVAGELGGMFPIQEHQLLLELLLQRCGIRAGRGVRRH